MSNITLDEIRRRFPNAAKSVLQANSPANPKGKPCPIVQESKEGDQGQQDRKASDPHRTKRKKVDGSVHPKFRIAVTFRRSDLRERDPDGGLSTILDCLVAARKRLNELAQRASRLCD